MIMSTCQVKKLRPWEGLRPDWSGRGSSGGGRTGVLASELMNTGEKLKKGTQAQG